MAVVVLFLCAIITFIVLTKSLLFNRKRDVNLPPQAAGALPIVGHTFLVLANRNRLYQVVIEILTGPFLKRDHEAATVRIGTWEIYVVMNPDDSCLLANCLKKDLVAYSFFKPVMGDNGLITADVPIWKRHRKLLNPTFNQSVLDTYLIEFNDRSRQLVNEDLMEKAGKEYFDPLPYVRQTVLYLVCTTIMGVSVDESNVTEEFGKAIDVFTGCMVERFRKFWYHSDFLYSFSDLKKKQDSAADTFLDLSHGILRRKKAKLIAQEKYSIEVKEPSKSRFKSFLELLLELPKDDALTEDEILEELNTFIAAGFDTTYHAICMTLLTLGSYPEVQRKAFEEHQEIFKGTDRDIEKQDLTQLKYLEAVIKETMRLYPIVFTIGRKLDAELKLKNYTLPAGSRCFTSIYHVCRHPVWGPDAEQFRPERWLDGSLTSDAARAYAVFGLGKRSCIGSNFAMMMMKAILSHVVRRYRISGDVTRLVQKLDVVVTPVSGHHIRIEPRTNL